MPYIGRHQIWLVLMVAVSMNKENSFTSHRSTLGLQFQLARNDLTKNQTSKIFNSMDLRSKDKSYSNPAASL